MIRHVAICGAIFLLIGCVPTHRYYSKTSKSYEINEVHEAVAGSTMLSYEYRHYVAGRTWVLIAGSFWPGEEKLSERERRERGETTEADLEPRKCGEPGKRTEKSYRQELVYMGRTGDLIHINYKEYGKDFVWPIFMEELQYDLNESRIVVCAGYTIEIIEATNEFVRFSVSNEPKTRPRH